MAYKFTPIVIKVVKLLEKKGFHVERMSGGHIIINKIPSLRRPIVLVKIFKYDIDDGNNRALSFSIVGLKDAPAYIGMRK